MTVVEQNAFSAVAAYMSELGEIAKQLKLANQLKLLELRRASCGIDRILEDSLDEIEAQL